jgi:hypothetical protein
MAKQPITFVVDSDRDRDILHWLDGHANKSAAIREAIRAHLERGTVTLTEVYEAIQDLKQGGWVPATEEGSSARREGDEPEDVAEALDSLGL